MAELWSCAKSSIFSILLVKQRAFGTYKRSCLRSFYGCFRTFPPWKWVLIEIHGESKLTTAAVLGAEVTFDYMSTESDCGGSVRVDRFRSFIDLIPWKADMMEHMRLQEAHTVTHTLVHTAFPLLASHALLSLPWCGEEGGSFLFCSVSVCDKLATFPGTSGHKSVKWLGLHQQNSLHTLIHQC